MTKELPEEKFQKEVEKERYEILYQVEEWLEGPILILGFIWLLLLIVELIWGLSTALEGTAFAIWGIFIFDFSLRFFLAPQKIRYLKKNWLTALSLAVPALRIFRFIRFLQILRAARAARSIQLLKVLGSINRGIKAFRKNFGRRGFIYVFLLSVIVVLVGAAGMYAFEHDIPTGKGFTSYGDAVWWTAMIITTMGSEAWPASPEGRILGFFLSLYGVGILGYITATLATFFIGREADNKESEIPGVKEIEELKKEIVLLREEIEKLR
ncbi:MAG: ion transporter [Ignavibacteriaceae bacterium]